MAVKVLLWEEEWHGQQTVVLVVIIGALETLKLPSLWEMPLWSVCSQINLVRFPSICVLQKTGYNLKVSELTRDIKL